MSEFVSPIDQLIHSTIRIECETNQGMSSGSGYFFRFLEGEGKSVPCIVTNKHVIEGSMKGKFHMSLMGDDGKAKIAEHQEFQVDDFEKYWIKHIDASIDLAVFPIAWIINEAEKSGSKYFFLELTKEIIAPPQLLNSLPTMQEIIMIGYPNGIWDAMHNLPIIRRGITATHPKLLLNGKPEFLIDAACFPGSSGSPVFLANIGSFVNENGALCAGNRIALLGTLYAGPQHTATGEVRIVEVPTAVTSIAVSTIPSNLGLVIHANKVLDFEPILKNLVETSNI